MDTNKVKLSQKTIDKKEKEVKEKEFEINKLKNKLSKLEKEEIKQENKIEDITEKIEILTEELKSIDGELKTRENLLKEAENKNIEKIKEIKERKEEINEENGKIINDFNFIISQNKVIFTDKITKKEIKSGGKYSTGYDHQTGESVQVLDKDYGKSAELMRTLLESESYTPLRKKLLMLLVLLVLLFIIGIVIFSFIPKKDNTINKVKINNGITQGQITPTIIKKEELDKKENNDVKIINNEIIKNQENQIEIKENNEIESLKLNYEIESLKLELNRIIEEKNLLTHENFNLKEENEKNLLIIENLKVELKIFAEKSQNLTQEAFLLHLGKLVYEGCEKTEKETQKNKCKDLYFKYIKND